MSTFKESLQEANKFHIYNRLPNSNSGAWNHATKMNGENKHNYTTLEKATFVMTA